MAEAFELPVAVDNDVNLAVLGEQWFGAGRGARNIILLALGTGMGGGVVIDGVIYRGHHEAAGEVGYFLPGIQALGCRYDDGFGAMENIVSGLGIAKRATALLSAGQPASEPPPLSAGEVFEAARRGEAWAVQVVDETVDYLSVAVANVATLLDPEVIILGGGIANSADMLIAPILKRIDGAIQHTPRLVASQLGSKATVMGAISLVLHLTKDYYAVRRL
jgi:glucokinase